MTPPSESVLPEWAARLAQKAGFDPTADTYLPLVLLAGFLDSLSRGYGMSESHESEFRDRMVESEALAPLVEHYFGTQQEWASDLDVVRDRFYQAVLAASSDPPSQTLARSIGASLTRERILFVSQVYWALSRDARSRPDLPFRDGPARETINSSGVSVQQKPWIWLPAKVVDLAQVKRVMRSTLVAGMGETSGRSLRDQGRVVCLVVAAHLLACRPLPAELAGSIHTQLAQDLEPPFLVPQSGGAVVGAFIHETAEDALAHVRLGFDTAGNLTQSLKVTAALIAVLKADPTDSDLQDRRLLEERVRLVSDLMSLGRLDDAMESLTAVRTEVSERLARDPQSVDAQLGFAVVTSLFALVSRLVRFDEALSDSLERAVEAAQNVVDSTGEHDEILALALIVQALHTHFNEADPDENRGLSRALAIGKRLSRSRTGGDDFASVYIAALLARYFSLLQLDRLDEARRCLREAQILVEEVRRRTDKGLFALFAAYLNLLESLNAFLAEDSEAAEHLLIEAVSQTESFFDARPNVAVEAFGGLVLSNLASIQVSALLVLAACAGEKEDLVESRARFSRARQVKDSAGAFIPAELDALLESQLADFEAALNHEE